MRKRTPRVLWLVFFTTGWWLVALPVANAYIDPGSGSIIFQAIIAGAMAAGLATKMFWRRLKSFFAAPFRSRRASTADVQPETGQRGP